MATVIIVNHQFHSRINSSFSSFAYGLQDGLSRVVWAISMCYIIFACIHDSSGPINWFLSLPAWQVMARISFSIYLVHRPIPLLTVGTMKIPPIISEATFCAIALLNCILSIFIAILATLAFESPIINLEKLFFGTYLTNGPSMVLHEPNAKELNDLILEKKIN